MIPVLAGGKKVARGGLEPPHTAPKAAVLPLDDRAMYIIIILSPNG